MGAAEAGPVASLGRAKVFGLALALEGLVAGVGSRSEEGGGWAAEGSLGGRAGAEAAAHRVARHGRCCGREGRGSPCRARWFQERERERLGRLWERIGR